MIAFGHYQLYTKWVVAPEDWCRGFRVVTAKMAAGASSELLRSFLDGHQSKDSLGIRIDIATEVYDPDRLNTA
jgi:hypothetical protein